MNTKANENTCIAKRAHHRGAIAPGLLVATGLLGLVAILLVYIIGASDAGAIPLASISARDLRIVGFTTFQATLSTLLSLVAGFLLAWALSHQRSFPGRSVLIALFSTALVLPTLVIVLGIISIFGRRGWLNDLSGYLTGSDFGSYIYGLTGILVAHVYLNASFSLRTMLNRLDAIPAEKRKLVKSLNLSVWKRFLLIEWPAVKPALPRLAAVIFLLCFTSFAIVLVLGGSPRFNTLEVAIFEAVKLDFDLNRAVDLAILQLIICAGVVLITGSLKSPATLISPGNPRITWAEPRCSSLIQVLIIAVFSLFFLMPLVAIMVDGLRADFAGILAESAFRKSLATSLALALLSSLITLICALAISNASRNFLLPHRLGSMKHSNSVAKALTFSGKLYLAVPSLVLALGFFLLARDLPGSLIFWGFIAILIANTLLALPFALAILLPAMEKTASRYDRLVFSLDLSRTDRWRTVEWPVLRSDIGYVFAVAFCLSFGDLGVIALFGSQDFATLPWYLYQKMGSYRTDDAAGVALIMLTITVIIFFMMPKLFARQNANNGSLNAQN